MSGGHGTGSSAQVPCARCAWVPMSMSYHASLYMALLLQGPLWCLPGIGEPSSVTKWGLELGYKDTQWVSRCHALKLVNLGKF
jgi:hypothetical protein